MRCDAGRMPIYLAIRAAVLSLVTAAAVLTMIVVARSQPQPVVIVVPAPATHVSPATFMQPAWCAGYNWRNSSIDLRPWCGWN